MNLPPLSRLSVKGLKRYGHELIDEYVAIGSKYKNYKDKIAEAYRDLSLSMGKLSPHFGYMDSREELMKACNHMFALVQKRRRKLLHKAKYE